MLNLCTCAFDRFSMHLYLNFLSLRMRFPFIPSFRPLTFQGMEISLQAFRLSKFPIRNVYSILYEITLQ